MGGSTSGPYGWGNGPGSTGKYGGKSSGKPSKGIVAFAILFSFGPLAGMIGIAGYLLHGHGVI